MIDVFANTKSEVCQDINFYIDSRRIPHFNRKHLETLLNYDCDNQMKNIIFNCIFTQGALSQKLSSLGEKEFCDALAFMLNPDSLEERIHLMDRLIEDGKYHAYLADKINHLPLEFIKYLGSQDDSIEEDQKKLLEDISSAKQDKYANNYYFLITATPIEQLSNLLELVVNENFRTFSMQKRSKIIHQLGSLGYDLSHPERDQERYRKKRDFLVGDISNPGFLTGIDDEYLDDTFSFINKEEDLEVLDAKFLVLSRLKMQLQAKELSKITYQAYLKSLEDTISNMELKDKIKYLDSHSKYFQKHSLESFTKKLNHSKHKDELVSALEENKKYKKLKYHYKLVDLIDQYGFQVASRIINQIANCQEKENKKSLFHIINSDSFRMTQEEGQLNILNNIDFLPYTLTSKIYEHYPYIKNVLNEKSKITFVNKDEDAKIKVKLKKKKKSELKN